MNIQNANLLLTGLGIAGIAALFLPFGGNISPMDRLRLAFTTRT